MRITKQKAAENRARVVEEAARLFRARGFYGVGVAEIMAAAGMTHGGFYNHFASKDDVEAAALARVFERALESLAATIPSPEAYADYRGRYLSPAARDAGAPRCPMVAFAADVSRQSEGVREAYAKGLRAYLEGFERLSGLPRGEALAEYARLVGALTLARSVAANDAELSDEILAAARKIS